MSERKIVDMYAGAVNQWGPEKEVYSVFGDKAGCKISVGENNTNGNIRIQIRYSTPISTLDWEEYLEGTYINAQVIRCRLSSTSTGGSVKLMIQE